jgi:hypothetical protein
MNTMNSTHVAVGVGVELAPAVQRYFNSTLTEMKVAGSSYTADFFKNLTKEVLDLMARAPTQQEPYKVRMVEGNTNVFDLSL